MSEDLYTNQEEVRDFVNRLSDKTGSELSAIITRYISYRPEAVEAALYVSVEKGLISYDLRELLWQQIASSFKVHESKIKHYRWESSNAFVRYYAGYNDEEIYAIIEDPNNIAIDVYHALLVVARERELISDADFDRYYSDAKNAIMREEDINRSILIDIFGMEEGPDESQIEIDLEAEREKYWKCPKCNENVGLEYAVCWNCQSSIPEEIVHPDPLEIRSELLPKMPSSLLRIGFTLIGTGIFVFALDMLRHYRYSSYLLTHIGGYIVSGFFVLTGLGFIIYGAFTEKENK
jgi:hypothetical protein